MKDDNWQALMRQQVPSIMLLRRGQLIHNITRWQAKSGLLQCIGLLSWQCAIMYWHPQNLSSKVAVL